MHFHEKLNLLLSAFNISNSRLARSLAIDPSLVSRWRKGTRFPAQKSSYIEKIAEIVAKQIKNDSQKNKLLEITGLQPSFLDGEKDIASFIHKWLLDDRLPDPVLVEKFLQKVESFSADNFSLFPLPENTGGTWGEISAGKTEFLYGIEGQKEGALKFLEAASLCTEPGTLWLYSDEKIDWFRSDPEFFKVFFYKSYQIIKKSCRVKMVHNISRDMQEMFAGIELWLPLYMTGNVEPYYCPLYRPYHFYRTIFVAEKTAVLTSTTLEGFENQALRIFSTDPRLVECMQKEFEKFLAMCRPLMQVLSIGKEKNIIKLQVRFTQAKADSTTLDTIPGRFLISASLLDKILAASSLDRDEKNQVLKQHQKIHHNFMDNLMYNNHTDIISMLFLEKRQHPEEITIPLFTEKGLIEARLSPETYKQYLEEIVLAMERFNNYELFTVSDNSYTNLNISIKDETGVIVTKKDYPFLVFAINHPYMTDAFYTYAEELKNIKNSYHQQKKAMIQKLKAIKENL